MLTDIIVNFTHAAVVVFGLLTVLWAISVAAKDASLIDIFWGFGFLIVGAVCLYLANPKSDYLILLCGLPIIWGARLTLYLAKRNLGHGEDKRYIAMQKRAAKKGMSEMAWRLRSLFTIYFGQGVLIMIVSAPVWIATAVTRHYSTLPENDIGQAIGLIAIIGGLLWLIGFLFEAIGDWQLAKFMKANKNYDGPQEEKPVLNTGLWRYTRHPNYFGNACMWWGIYLVACQVPYGWVSIFGPLIMNFLLTRVSGKALLERDMGKRQAYRDYIEKTSGFFPLPPKS